MNLHSATATMPGWIAVIAWAYLLSNSARIFTYVPQILAVWHCRDGARTISLLTWGSWVVSNIAATLYGLWVGDDGFFVMVSAINTAGSGTVTALTVLRRWEGMTQQTQRRELAPR